MNVDNTRWSLNFFLRQCSLKIEGCSSKPCGTALSFTLPLILGVYKILPYLPHLQNDAFPPGPVQIS